MKNEIIKGGFRKREVPLSADYRPMYKLGLITIILGLVCRGKKSSLSKLHFFIWALKTEGNMKKVSASLFDNDPDQLISWGVEPALNKALNFALAENLVGLHDDKYTLTESGSALLKEIESDSELFTVEKAFLLRIGKQGVTEDYINKLTDRLSK